MYIYVCGNVQCNNTGVHEIQHLGTYKQALLCFTAFMGSESRLATKKMQVVTQNLSAMCIL